MSLRSTLFGSRLRSGIVLVVAAVGMIGAAVALGILGVPGVAGVENNFGEVNSSTTVIETNLTVDNPNPIGVSLGSVVVNYTVSMNDVRMATGEKRGVSVEAGTSTLTFRTLMDNERIPAWWVSHLRADERTALRVDATVSGLLGQQVETTPVTRTVETDIIGEFNSTETRPVNADLPVVGNPVAYINRTSATWGDVSREESTIDANFVVYNPNEFPIVLTEISYEATMNDIDLGDGTTEREYVIPPGETRTVEAMVVLENERLDEWWATHLQRNQVTDLRIAFATRVGTESATVEVPLPGVAYEKRIETDLFGTKPASTAGNDTDDGRETSTTETTTSVIDTGVLNETTTELLNTTDTGVINETTEGDTTTDDGGVGL